MTGFDYSDAITGMTTEISKIEMLADKDARKALKDCGNVYKRNCSAFCKTGKWDGVGDGARVSVKKSRQSGQLYLVVKGAKGRASLWHLANDGFIHWRSGNKVPGNHFVDKAESASEADVEAIIDKAIDAMLGGK